MGGTPVATDNPLTNNSNWLFFEKTAKNVMEYCSKTHENICNYLRVPSFNFVHFFLKYLIINTLIYITQKIIMQSEYGILHKIN